MTGRVLLQQLSGLSPAQLEYEIVMDVEPGSRLPYFDIWNLLVDEPSADEEKEEEGMLILLPDIRSVDAQKLEPADNSYLVAQ